MSAFLESIVGDTLGAGLDFLSQSKLQGDQREWSAHMAKNAVRYRVADLKAAGINPILAAGAGLGGGLSFPSASAGGGTSLSGMGARAVSSAASAALARKQNLVMDSEIGVNNAHAAKLRGDTLSPHVADQVALGAAGLSESSAAKVEAERLNLPKLMEEIDAKIRDLESQVRRRDIESDFAPSLRAVELAMKEVERKLLELGVPPKELAAHGARKALEVAKGAEAAAQGAGKEMGNKVYDAVSGLRGVLESLKNLPYIYHIERGGYRGKGSSGKY